MTWRMEPARWNTSCGQTPANDKMAGALAIARFIGFGGFVTSITAILYVALRQM